MPVETRTRRALTVKPFSVVLEEAPVPESGGDALLRVLAAGVCGSDVHLFDGTHAYGGYPLVQGHELAATVLDPGSRSDLRPGDQVVVDPVISCGDCIACREGAPGACERIQVVGVHRDGGFSELLRVPGDRLIAAEGLDPITAALCEPLGVAIRAVERAGIGAGDTAVIVGAGSIGRSVALVCRDLGARALVLGREELRLQLARSLGAETARLGPGSVTDEVLAFTGGDGPRSVFEATGAASMLRLCLDLVAPTGTVVAIGVSDDELTVPVSLLSRKEITVRGSRNTSGSIGPAVDLLRRNRELIDGQVTHVFPLAEAGDAMQMLREAPHRVGKAVIDVRRVS